MSNQIAVMPSEVIEWLQWQIATCKSYRSMGIYKSDHAHCITGRAQNDHRLQMYERCVRAIHGASVTGYDRIWLTFVIGHAALYKKYGNEWDNDLARAARLRVTKRLRFGIAEYKQEQAA